jgi:hypothetical protein
MAALEHASPSDCGNSKNKILTLEPHEERPGKQITETPMIILRSINFLLNLDGFEKSRQKLQDPSGKMMFLGSQLSQK